MFTSEDVIRFYALLESNGISVWIVGGWGIDALLGEHTRPHKDLDLLVRLDDVARLRETLSREGFTLKLLWEENQSVADGSGRMVETGFVLREPGGLEIDIHALQEGEDGTYLPAWVDDPPRVFSAADLGGVGVIGGVAVRCASAQLQLQSHTGYTLPEYQVEDLRRMREKFPKISRI